jgi:DNA replication protein DnaC
VPKVEPPLEWKSAKWWANRPVDERLALANFPKRYAQYSMESIGESYRNLATKWIQSASISPGLLITGRADTGKTVTAQAIGRHIIETQKKMVYFLSADRYVEIIKDSFDKVDGELPDMYNMPHLLRFIKDTFHVVIIDALGRERPTEFSQYELGSLLRRRYEDCRQVIVTTSLSMADITARYGDSARSVIADFDAINLNSLGSARGGE